MGNVAKIDNGFKTYDIVDQNNKKVGQFSFNPADTNMIERYNEVVSEFPKVVDMFQKKEGKKETSELLAELDQYTYELIDKIFNAEVSANFFSIMGPFSVLANGHFFAESVIETIGNVIESEMGARVKKMNSKIKKYTAKYEG